MSTPDILKARELAELLGCAETTVEERARKGDLPGLKFGDGGWVFPRDALLRRLNEKALAVAADARDQNRVPPVATYTERAEMRRRPTLPSI